MKLIRRMLVAFMVLGTGFATAKIETSKVPVCFGSDCEAGISCVWSSTCTPHANCTKCSWSNPTFECVKC